MIKVKATARVKSISPVLSIKMKNGSEFKKREIVLDDTHKDDAGNTYENFVCVEFTKDRMALLDGFAAGQLVVVEATVQGRYYNEKLFYSLRGLSIQPFGKQSDNNVAPDPATTQQPTQSENVLNELLPF